MWSSIKLPDLIYYFVKEMNHDIFISYRRKGGFETAKHLFDLLTKDGYRVCLDFDTLREGDFDKALLSRIDDCQDFILIVDANAFERTLDSSFDSKKDWLRQELAYALKQGKNVIPVLLSGAEFPDNLPLDISQVAYKHGPSYSLEYFDSFYEKLKDFLHNKSTSRKKIWFYSVLALIIVGLSLLFINKQKFTDGSGLMQTDDFNIQNVQKVDSSLIVNETGKDVQDDIMSTLKEETSVTLAPSHSEFINDNSRTQASSFSSTDITQKTSGSSRSMSDNTPSDLVSEKYNQIITGAKAGHDYVDLGLSVMWATCNVGALKPSNSGLFFAWGEVNSKSDFSWDSYALRTSGSNMYNVVFFKYNSGSVSVLNKLELVDDVAHNLWLGDWRIPTKDEFDELINNCVWSWTKIEGVDGYKIVSKKTGFEQNSIFLPAVGFMQRKAVQNNGSRGCYWTSSISSNSHSAYYLGFISTQKKTYSQERYIGCSIRAVCGK